MCVCACVCVCVFSYVRERLRSCVCTCVWRCVCVCQSACMQVRVIYHFIYYYVLQYPVLRAMGKGLSQLQSGFVDIILHAARSTHAIQIFGCAANKSALKLEIWKKSQKGKFVLRPASAMICLSCFRQYFRRSRSRQQSHNPTVPISILQCSPVHCHSDPIQLKSCLQTVHLQCCSH